ncbi:MAG: hypothetical protein SOZ84_04770 [Treponema sp.]|nr:hypothetical protein [Treponema sp.]
MNVGTRLTCMMLTLAGIVLLGAGCAGKNTAITVISREDGSGTRSAFVELLGIAADGVDRTTELAIKKLVQGIAPVTEHTED